MDFIVRSPNSVKRLYYEKITWSQIGIWTAILPVVDMILLQNWEKKIILIFPAVHNRPKIKREKLKKRNNDLEALQDNCILFSFIDVLAPTRTMNHFSLPSKSYTRKKCKSCLQKILGDFSSILKTEARRGILKLCLQRVQIMSQENY